MADFSITFPVEEMSCPAPAVVWQALRSGAAATIESKARPMMTFLYMLESFLRVVQVDRDRRNRRDAS